MPPGDSRQLVTRPAWGNLRQGTIFSGAIADGYSGCDVHGIVITAHCDLTHGKVPLVNYLPAVHMADWFSRDFAASLIGRIRSDLNARLSDILRSEGYSATILTVHDRRRAIDALFPSTARGKSGTRGDKAREIVNALDLLDDLDRPAPESLTSDQLAALEEISPKFASRLRVECLRNALNGYYFLSHIDSEGPHTGFVVLLRQIYHLPLPTALAVANGTDLQHDTLSSAISPLTRDPPEFAMPIGQLVSPYLEHLMQNFSTLFARIGIPDLPQDLQRHLAGG